MVHRRQVLLAGAGLALAAGTGAEAAERNTMAPAGSVTFTQALATCVETGNICLQHCLVALGKGDTSLAECAIAVRDMLAICNATGVLAAGQARRLTAAAALCADICADCEKACRVHEDHHPECKACAEACAVVVREAKKVAA